MTDACRSNPLSGPPADSPGHLKQARAHWLLAAADVNVYTQQQLLIFQLEIHTSVYINYCGIIKISAGLILICQ